MKGGSLPEQNGFLNTPFSETVALVWWRFYKEFFPNVLHNTLAGLLLLLLSPPPPTPPPEGYFWFIQGRALTFLIKQAVCHFLGDAEGTLLDQASSFVFYQHLSAAVMNNLLFPADL